MRPAAPGLVATDLDGTLLGPDGALSAASLEVLGALDARGVPVVFVTGRPLRWMDDLLGRVGGHGLAVVSNGALVWSAHDRRAVRLHDFAAGEVTGVAAAIRDAVPGSAFAVETLAGIALEPGFHERAPVPPDAPRAPLASLPHEGVLKLLARHEELDPQGYWDLAAAAVGERAVITWSSDSTMLEISAPGVTKATTLAEVAAGLGVEAAATVAFGDMPNDLPMLAWAGTSYAVANAHASVRAAADEIVPSNAEDGVAATLARLFGL